MIPAPVLLPWEQVPVFEWGDAEHRVQKLRWPEPRRSLAEMLASGPRECVTMRTVDVFRHEYQSPLLRWRGWIFCTEDDEQRLLDALWMAETAILACCALCLFLGIDGHVSIRFARELDTFAPQTGLREPK